MLSMGTPLMKGIPDHLMKGIPDHASTHKFDAALLLQHSDTLQACEFPSD